MSTNENTASGPTNDGSYNDAVSTKLAQIWAEMWLEMVRSGVPKKVATKFMLMYLRVTLGMIGK
jgi:hypothetical protein